MDQKCQLPIAAVIASSLIINVYHIEFYILFYLCFDLFSSRREKAIILSIGGGGQQSAADLPVRPFISALAGRQPFKSNNMEISQINAAAKGNRTKEHVKTPGQKKRNFFPLLLLQYYRCFTSYFGIDTRWHWSYLKNHRILSNQWQIEVRSCDIFNILDVISHMGGFLFLEASVKRSNIASWVMDWTKNSFFSLFPIFPRERFLLNCRKENNFLAFFCVCNLFFSLTLCILLARSVLCPIFEGHQTSCLA